MPGGDRTGPRGGGPRTGRGLGYCAGYEQPGYTAQGPAQRMGWGFRGGGGGRGRRYRFFDYGWPDSGRGRFAPPPAAQDQDVDFLKAQTQELQEALQNIQARLDEIKA
jgi:hypothetical protein